MAYIYQAALWCDDCGEQLRAALKDAGKAPADPTDESSFDSDDFPKGPFSDDDPADSPHHCDSAEDCLNGFELDDGRRVGAIVSGLTEDGIAYVRDAEDSPCARAWREHYDLPADDDDDDPGVEATTDDVTDPDIEETTE